MTIQIGRTLEPTPDEQWRALDRAVNGLRDDYPGFSAYVSVIGWQRAVLWSVSVALTLFGIFKPVQTVIVLIGLCALAYVATMLDRVLIFRQGLTASAIVIPESEARAIGDSELPRYTILVPAYDEPEVVGDLIGAMSRLDYPADKLQILLLLEADDDITIAAARACINSESVTIMLVPPAQPRTKPKACNYGLEFATGDIITVYDAEDLPDPLQLRRVVAAFRKLPEKVVCVQCELVHRNGRQNLLTGWFTAEYGLWFGYLLAGMMHSDAPIPLGGTSNHVRRDVLDRIGAWDPFNVTEDADLGLRIRARGYHTAVLDSPTFEEATSDPINWVRQRSRWYKGYLQTWLVHMRQPRQLLESIGLRSFIRFNLVVAGTPLVAVINVLFWFITAVWLLGRPPAIGTVFPWYVYFPALIALIFGNGATIYMHLVALREDDRGDLILAAVTLPIFFVMMSIAAIKGVYQLIRNPSHWEKTFHGPAHRPGESA